MRVCLISDDAWLSELCRQVLLQFRDREWYFSKVGSYERALPSDLLLWDLKPQIQLPQESTFDPRINHIFFVESKDVSAIQDKLPIGECSVLPKPVNPIALKTLLEEAVAWHDLGYERRRIPAQLCSQRDKIPLPAIFKLQEHHRDQSSLLARRARDFRTPLMTLQGYCGLLLEHRLGLLNTDQMKALEHMQRSITRLSRLSMGIFELSMGPHRPHNLSPKEGDIEACIAQAVHELTLLAQLKKIELRETVAPPVETLYFDEMEIEQILVNFLDSACRFTPKGSFVEIRGGSTFWERRVPSITEHVEHAERRHSACETRNAYRVEVDYSRPGIPAAELEGIFGEYASDSESHGGSRAGFGLSTSRQFLGDCNGVIVAESNPKGVTFALMIPYDRNLSANLETSRRVRAIEPGSLLPWKGPPMDLTSGKTVLVVDDDVEAGAYLRTVVKLQGYDALLADSGKDALRFLERAETAVSLVLVDVMTNLEAGIQTLRDIRRLRSDLPVILIYSKLSLPGVMEAADEDSVTCLEQPGPTELIRAVEEAINKRTLSPMLSAKPTFAVAEQSPLARNARMMGIEHLLQQVGPSDFPVMLHGETGVGKEVLARQLHLYSPRAQNSFQTVNCAALPPDLVEGDLFGYELGASTGATKDRPGKLERARGGTILLDEIGEMDFRMQTKLLQILKDGEFHRLGGSETLQVDVRIVTATRSDLHRAIRERTFREDLYYRLNVIYIHVPPLRERKDEIPWLADYFLKKYAPPPPPSISPELMGAMLAYDWPGNVRELENMMRKFLLLRQPKITIDELCALASAHREIGMQPSNSTDDSSKGASILQEVQQSKQREEREAILAALNATHWNRKHAAKRLKLDYKALLYKMKKLGIESKPD
jgi:two-component system response regulator AtoC